MGIAWPVRIRIPGQAYGPVPDPGPTSNSRLYSPHFNRGYAPLVDLL